MGKANDATGVFELIEMRGGDACWPWKGGWGGRVRDPRPYFQYEGRRTQAYRVVYELVHGFTLTRDQYLMHSCDNGTAPIGCCNPKHLRIGNAAENAAEMVQRQRFGLPHMVVRNIRKLLGEGRPQHEIAQLYGVSRETISGIATGRVYKHAPDEEPDAPTDPAV